MTPLTPTPSPAWHEHAACRDTDPDLFFPESRGAQANLIAAQAKQVCARCQVRASCLETALANHERFGVWGGTTARERMRLQRERRAS